MCAQFMRDRICAGHVGYRTKKRKYLMHVFLICLSSICYDDTLGGTLYKFQHFLRYIEKPCDRSYRYTRVLSKRGYMFCHVFFCFVFVFRRSRQKCVVFFSDVYIAYRYRIYICLPVTGRKPPSSSVCIYHGRKMVSPQKKKKKKRRSVYAGRTCFWRM